MVLDENDNVYLDITHINKDNPTNLSLGKAFTLADAGKSFSADITYRTSEGGRLTASVDGKQAENSDPSNNT